MLNASFTWTPATPPLIREGGSIVAIQYQSDTLLNRRLVRFELVDDASAPAATEINSGPVNLQVLQGRTLDRAVPDGQGGLLLSAAQNGVVFRVGSDGALSQPQVFGFPDRGTD